MSESRISPQSFISGLLRQNIIDYSSSARSGANLSANWIYPDKPRIENLSGNHFNFPRCSVMKMAINSKGDLGAGGTETEDMVNLLINVYTIKEDIVVVRTETEESHTFEDGTDEYTLNSLPASLILTVTGTLDSGANTFISGTDYTLTDADKDGRYDTIDWSAGGDVPDDGTAFLVTYIRVLAGADLAEYIAHDIHIYLRDNWRIDTVPILFDYKMIREPTPISSMNDRIQRCEMQVQFTGVNIGD